MSHNNRYLIMLFGDCPDFLSLLPKQSVLLRLATRSPRVYSPGDLNGKKVSEQYKQGVQHGSMAGCQEILGHSGTLRKIYCALKLGRQS